jgi:formate dehydrogenase subunit gamma
LKANERGRRRRDASEPEEPATYDAAAVQAVLTRWQGVPGNLMPILHDVQAALGYVPPDCVPQLARALNLSRAEIHGVITFYHDFRQAPVGRRIVKVCQAESCQAMGSRKLTATLERALECSLGETTADGEVTMDAVYCLGLCASSPAVMIDDEVIGRATAEDVVSRLATLREEDE